MPDAPLPPRSHLRGLVPFGLLVLSTVFLGCGATDGPGAVEDTVQTRLRRLSTLYTRYLGTGGAGVQRNKQGFVAFLNKLPKEERDNLQITDVEALFKSPRDNKEFLINWNVPNSMGTGGGAPMGGGAPPPPPQAPVGGAASASVPVFAMEAEGKEGKRFVVFLAGNVEEKSADECQKLLQTFKK